MSFKIQNVFLKKHETFLNISEILNISDLWAKHAGHPFLKYSDKSGSSFFVGLFLSNNILFAEQMTFNDKEPHIQQNRT